MNDDSMAVGKDTYADRGAMPDAAPDTGMTDPELIGYCDIHCESERALFNERQINRMIELAGYPDGFVRDVSIGWYSVHDEMKALVRVAQVSIAEQAARP
jgi:hypothetical protein